MTGPQIPPGPLDAPPYPSAPPGQSMRVAREAWRHALRGLPLGAYDRRLVKAIEDMADQPMLVGLASIAERVRRAGEADADARHAEFEVSVSAAMRAVLHLMDGGQHAKARDLLNALRANLRSDDNPTEGENR